MKTNQTFSILFWINKSKEKNGVAPIYCRISVNGKRVEMATKRSIDPLKWSNATSTIKGNSEEARTMNTFLSMMKNDILTKYNLLLMQSEYVTADKIKNLYLGVKEDDKMLIEVFKQHNDKMKERIGIDVARGTHTKFVTLLKKVTLFLKTRYKVRDIIITELNNTFIVEFEHYLKVNDQIAVNTTMQYIRSFKKILNICVANDWLVKNPFNSFKCALKPVIREVLSPNEILKLENKEFDIARLEEVRDIFLFCCYTGYAYIDVQKLSIDDLTIGIDGNRWIYTTRQKTGIQSNVPLLPQAQNLLQKYDKHKCRLIEKKLLPVKSNQKMNSYLKEISDVCGISKLLTMHIARHTFATTITLSNGVPIETVSKMLGHTKISITQIYAKVLENKVSFDMNVLMEKMAKKTEDDLIKLSNQG